MPRAADRFVFAFVGDLFDLELGPQRDDERALTQQWVLGRVDGAGEVMRAGLVTAGTLVATAVRLRTGQRYEELPADRRGDVARRLAATRIPFLGEYVRALRGLAVAYVYELRNPLG